MRASIWLSTTGLIAGSVSFPVYGQVVDEIITTATKREQTLQETPIAITVTDKVTIDRAKILDISDLQSVVPSLRVTQLQNSQSTNFEIRGFGNGANNAGIEPSVGVFIDGVFRSRSAAAIGDLPKLERVEVLHGPQSTLFGKNASAGVISVVTAKPSYEPEGYIEAGIGNYDSRQLKGYVTGGSDEANMAFSLGGSLNIRDGYSENVLGGKSVNDRNRWNLRGQALFEPSDRVQFRAIADYSQIDEICCTVGFLDAVAGITAPDPATGIVSTFDGISVINSITGDAPGGLGAQVFSPFDYKVAFNRDPVNEIKNRGISFHGDIDFDNFTLSSITSYRKSDAFYSTEVDFTSADIANEFSSGTDIKTFTQELRVTSTWDRDIDWMIGGFLSDESITTFDTLTYGTDVRGYVERLVTNLGSPGALGLIELVSGAGANAFFQPGQGTREDITQDGTAYSLFGTVDWHISDRLTLTGGLNYTNDEKSVTFAQSLNTDNFAQLDLVNTIGPILGLSPEAALTECIDPDEISGDPPRGFAFPDRPGFPTTCNISLPLQPLQFLPPLLGLPNAVEDGESRDDKLTYTFRLAYDVSDDVNIYGSYSTGFKSTSWNLSRNSRPALADADALEAAGLLPVNTEIVRNPDGSVNQRLSRGFGSRFAGPESSRVFELGLKAKFDRGSINLAVFDQSIKGFQSNTFIGTSFVLANAGEQSTKGVEWDAIYRPVDELTLGFSGTYLDPIFDDYQNAPGFAGTVVDSTGDRPSGTHEFSLSTSATYNHDFGNGRSGYIRGDFLYESPTFLIRAYRPIPILEAQGNTITETVNGFEQTEREVKTFNASAGMNFNNGLSVQIWGRNIFKDEYLLTAFPGVAQPDTVYSYPNPPRTYGISVRKDF